MSSVVASSILKSGTKEERTTEGSRDQRDSSQHQILDLRRDMSENERRALRNQKFGT